jgi:hypothetical protein
MCDLPRSATLGDHTNRDDVTTAPFSNPRSMGRRPNEPDRTDLSHGRPTLKAWIHVSPRPLWSTDTTWTTLEPYLSIIAKLALAIAVGGPASSLLVLQLSFPRLDATRCALGCTRVGQMLVAAKLLIAFDGRLGRSAIMISTAMLPTTGSVPLRAITVHSSIIQSELRRRLRAVTGVPDLLAERHEKIDVRQFAPMHVAGSGAASHPTDAQLLPPSSPAPAAGGNG